MTRKSSTDTLIAAMRILARDIQSGDGVANAAISEAADRLEEQQARIAELDAQAAIGRRAVEMLADTAEKVESLVGWVGRNMNCGCTPLELVKARALIKIMRDAEQAAPEPATVPVNREALDALRVALEACKTLHQGHGLPLPEEGRLVGRVFVAARRLLEGGE